MTTWDLRPGAWEKVLADVECDVLITDPPYGERVHRGHNLGVAQGKALGNKRKKTIDYGFLMPKHVAKIVKHWSPRVRGWICIMTSHDLIPAWEKALELAGRYVFAPLPVLSFHQPRLIGDGPGSCVVHLIVARPRNRTFATWGSLPSRYDRSPGDPKPEHMGGKPIGIMRAIVRDYSRPDDLICDPFAGAATTLRAAIEEGRRAIGCEVDPKAFAHGLLRLEEPVCERLPFVEREVEEQLLVPGWDLIP